MAGPRRALLRVYQENGKTNDEMSILLNHGWTAFRLRVFVSPVRMAPDNSLENTLPLAKHIKAAGATFLLDLHFSDTWANPQHQDIPMIWTNHDRRPGNAMGVARQQCCLATQERRGHAGLGAGWQ